MKAYTEGAGTVFAPYGRKPGSQLSSINPNTDIGQEYIETELIEGEKHHINHTVTTISEAPELRPPLTMGFSHINFVIGPGALIAKDKFTGEVVQRYTEGQGVLLNDSLINPNIALSGVPIDLSVVDNMSSYFRQRLLSRQVIYEVE
jgi:hypothetical protein